MTNQFDRIRARLHTERNRLTEELNVRLGQNAAEGHEGSPYGKREETASECFELEKRLASAQRLREQLAEIERALAKLENGTYGLCDSCGKPIPPARLEAIPQANLCLECKTRRKKR